MQSNDANIALIQKISDGLEASNKLITQLIVESKSNSIISENLKKDYIKMSESIDKLYNIVKIGNGEPSISSQILQIQNDIRNMQAEFKDYKQKREEEVKEKRAFKWGIISAVAISVLNFILTQLPLILGNAN